MAKSNPGFGEEGGDGVGSGDGALLAGVDAGDLVGEEAEDLVEAGEPEAVLVPVENAEEAAEEVGVAGEGEPARRPHAKLLLGHVEQRCKDGEVEVPSRDDEAPPIFAGVDGEEARGNAAGVGGGVGVVLGQRRAAGSDEA